MKNFIISGIAAIALSFSSVVLAADKVGFVDGSKVIGKYEKQIEAKLQKEFQATQDKVVALQKQLMADNDKYKRDAATMSPDQVKALQASFEKSQTEFQRMSTELTQKRAARANEELEKLLEQVRKATTAVADKDGYTVVLQRGAAIYVKDANTDITDKVLAQVQYQ